MSSHLVKKVKVPVTLGETEAYFFYSFACGEYLLEKYGTPSKADNAFFGSFFTIQDGQAVKKSDEEIVTAGLLRVLKDYVHGMTITWAKENGCEPIDLFDLSIEDLGPVLEAVAKAIGIAMPQIKDADKKAKKDPQKP